MKKIAIITGASSGIGEKISVDLSEQGFKCILLGRDENRLKKIHRKCEDSNYLILDLSSNKCIESTTQKIKDLICSETYQLVLVNNAGIVERSSFVDTKMTSWAHQFQVNFFGPVEFTHSLISLLKLQRSAQIINISSTLGIKPIANTSAYSATKAAMNNWTQSLALELAPFNIAVNAICPGIIETPLQDFFETKDQQLRKTLNGMQPLGRIGTPSDISYQVVSMSNNLRQWMTGTIIPIDGGILLG